MRSRIIKQRLWDEDQDRLVRKHWLSKTTAEIGKLLGRTEKSVEARAQRLGLKKRLHQAHIVSRVKPSEPAPPSRHIRLPLVIKRTPQADYRPTHCQWLDGEPRLRNFCGNTNVPGYSYCQAHRDRCFTMAPAKIQVAA